MQQSALAREVTNLLDQIRARVKHDAVVERLSDQIEVLTRAWGTPAFSSDWDGLRLSPTETRIMDRLKANLGNPVSDDSLLDAVYFDSPDPKDAPLIKVFVAHLRRKLKDSKWAINTAWGFGYKLVPAELWENPRCTGRNGRVLAQ